MSWIDTQKLRLKIIDRYIIRKFLGTFFFAIAMIIIIVIVFDISEKIDDFLERHAPLKAIIFNYYLNFIPYFVNLFSPLFTFIAVIFFTSKMAARTEIVAILNSGISFRRFLRPYLVSATILAIMSFVLANFVIPQTNKTELAFERVYIKSQRKSRDIDIHMQSEPGVFIYVQNFNSAENKGYKFSLEKTNKTGLYYKMTAEFVKWDSLQKIWKLRDIRIRTINGMSETIHFIANKDTTFNFVPKDFRVDFEEAKTMGFGELRRFIDKQKMKGTMNIIDFEVEKHKRIAFPFATIVLTLIAVSLSSRKVRGGIGVHLGSGIAISFSFILFMQVSTTFAIYGNLPPALSVWLPNIIFGILGVYLLKIAPK